MNTRIVLSIGVTLVSLASVARAALAYPDPPGGWTYLYDGDERVVGDDTTFSWLDGTWSHNNGSDAFDGSEIGGEFSASNKPGGVSLLEQEGADFLRMQDPGDPRDYDSVYGYGSGDPSNRKVYFGHDTLNDAPDNADIMMDTGVTLTFRARIPTAAKASVGGSFLIDPLLADGQGGAGPKDYPAEGDGYVTWNDGKGNFVIRQGGDGTPEHPAGALAFSLTLPADNVGTGPTANFAGLTMNEKNGNLPSNNVDFGEGTATNLVAFDPTDWHELYLVIRKDPANIATHEVFIFKNGELTPQVFKITMGTGKDVEVENYLAMGGPATDQNWALDVDWFGFKNEAVFPPGSIDNLPPSITGVSIAENAMFVPAASGLSFQASVEPASTNTLPVAGFSLVLNDEDLSSGLSVTGPEKSRSVTYNGLQANRFYKGAIVVADQAGRKATNALSFDTFVESAGVAVESEDYNHTGGQFVASPVPGSYANLQGTAGVDFVDTTADNNDWRQDAVDLAAANDRNLGLYQYTLLTDAFGDPVTVALSGQQTVRVTALTANNDLNQNLLFFIPDPGVGSTAVATAVPGPDQLNVLADTDVEISLVDGANQVVPGSVKLWFNGAEVTSAATVSDTADGVRVFYDPGVMAGQRVYNVQLEFADNAASPQVVSKSWSFTTAAYANVPPQLGTALGTGADPGLKWRTHQLESGNTITVAAAESQLAGATGASVHIANDFGLGSSWVGPQGGDGYFVMSTINLELEALEDGQFFGTAAAPQNVPDDYIPGVNVTFRPGENVAAECLAYLEFPQAGLYQMVVNSDDGFRVTVGNASEPTYLELGRFDGTRGASDSVLQVGISQPGVYLFRLMWFQGTGGASVEWYTVGSDGPRALINSAQAGAIKAYQRRTVAEPELPPLEVSMDVAWDSNTGEVVITWDAAVQTLQESEDLSVWSDVAGTSPFRVTPSGPAKFYQLLVR